MAKEISKILKLQVRGGAANPSPPVGPALGSAGVNIMEFCKQFNARTQDKPGKVLPVVITVFSDKSFEFVIKTPPAAVQLLEAAKVKKGSGEPHVKKVAKVTWDQVKTIAEDKGGKVLGSISKKLDFLIVGNSKPTKKKIDQAKSLGIKVINEKEWEKILNS